MGEGGLKLVLYTIHTNKNHDTNCYTLIPTKIWWFISSTSDLTYFELGSIGFFARTRIGFNNDKQSIIIIIIIVIICIINVYQVTLFTKSGLLSTTAMAVLRVDVRHVLGQHTSKVVMTVTSVRSDSESNLQKRRRQLLQTNNQIVNPLFVQLTACVRIEFLPTTLRVTDGRGIKNAWQSKKKNNNNQKIKVTVRNWPRITITTKSNKIMLRVIQKNYLNDK